MDVLECAYLVSIYFEILSPPSWHVLPISSNLWVQLVGDDDDEIPSVVRSCFLLSSTDTFKLSSYACSREWGQCVEQVQRQTRGQLPVVSSWAQKGGTEECSEG